MGLLSGSYRQRVLSLQLLHSGSMMVVIELGPFDSLGRVFQGRLPIYCENGLTSARCR